MRLIARIGFFNQLPIKPLLAGAGFIAGDKQNRPRGRRSKPCAIMVSTPYGVKAMLSHIDPDGPPSAPESAGSESTTFTRLTPAPNLRPFISHARVVASEKFAERFGLEFKPFAHSRETALRPIDA